MKVRLVKRTEELKDSKTRQMFTKTMFVAEGMPLLKEKWCFAEDIHEWDGTMGEERARAAFARWAKFQGHQIISILGEGVRS